MMRGFIGSYALRGRQEALHGQGLPDLFQESRSGAAAPRFPSHGSAGRAPTFENLLCAGCIGLAASCTVGGLTYVVKTTE